MLMPENKALDRLVLILAATDPEYVNDPDAVLEDRFDEFESMSNLVWAAGFRETSKGASHTVGDRDLLSDTVCSIDPDFVDYPPYVQDGDRSAKAHLVQAIFDGDWGILR